ncbi:hypothetical protein SNE25_13790 [Mucilaginibacter sabulilitoris]|uniref:Entericidin n=1 Tax=Mucilaginibacter sabulilitoris TaxID=1173583 RepID=A0ABZ0TV05_9SPHI|nr:hypothetical protein [Mucilaginibacter sabulilitoris]WPU96591.1 hypothetical protein SNE25_13790 [Mucilaginibacter sabulilitoris]
MKNSFKLGLVALAIATSFAACKGSGSGSAADSTKADSTVAVDSAKADSATAVDSTAKAGAAAVDSTKADSTKK